jgi:hypothetical protein
MSGDGAECATGGDGNPVHFSIVSAWQIRPGSTGARSIDG